MRGYSFHKAGGGEIVGAQCMEKAGIRLRPWKFCMKMDM